MFLAHAVFLVSLSTTHITIFSLFFPVYSIAALLVIKMALASDHTLSQKCFDTQEMASGSNSFARWSLALGAHSSIVSRRYTWSFLFLSTTQSTILFFPFFFSFVAPLPITEMALSSDNTLLCESLDYDEMEFGLDSFARWLLALRAYDPIAPRRPFLVLLLSSLLDPRFPLWFSRTTHNRVCPISHRLDSGIAHH